MGVNLHAALLRERSKRNVRTDEEALASWKSLFNEVDHLDDLMENRLVANDFQPLQRIPQPNRLFSEEDIRRIAIKYRLRFLDAALFKGDVPHAALAAMKKLEREVGHAVSGYKILAPAGLFHLAQRDKDPLLFAPAGNGHYYLVHQWGRELNGWRALLVYPFRSFETMVKTVVGAALLLALLPPDSVVMGPMDTSSVPARAIFFFYLIFAFGGLTALYGFSRMKNFSNALWNSRFMD